MAWFKKERKPRAAQRERLEIPPDAWEKCPNCGHMDLKAKFQKALSVCSECGYHFRFTAEEYVELLSDEGTWRELWPDLTSLDPLEFEGYPGRIEASEKKAGRSDAIYTGAARLDALPLHIGVMNFAFMGGSMGSVVGEKIARLARRSHEKKVPLILVSTSGAVIGFAGQRVIKQTIGQDLPEGFQTAEFLLEHGQIDDVVPRGSLRDTTARLLRHMQGQRPVVERAEAS